MATLAKRYSGGGPLTLVIIVIVVPTAIGIGIIAWIWICCRRKSRRKALLKGLRRPQGAQATQYELEEQLLTPEEKERRRKEKMVEGYKESSPFVYEYLQQKFATTTTSQEVLPETSESRERGGV